MNELKGIPVWGISEEGIEIELFLFLFLLLFMFIFGLKTLRDLLINRGRQIKKRHQILHLIKYDTSSLNQNDKNTNNGKKSNEIIQITKKTEKTSTLLNNNSAIKGYNYLKIGVNLNDIITTDNDGEIELKLIEVEALRKRRDKEGGRKKLLDVFKIDVTTQKQIMIETEKKKEKEKKKEEKKKEREKVEKEKEREEEEERKEKKSMTGENGVSTSVKNNIMNDERDDAILTRNQNILEVFAINKTVTNGNNVIFTGIEEMNGKMNGEINGRSEGDNKVSEATAGLLERKNDNEMKKGETEGIELTNKDDENVCTSHIIEGYSEVQIGNEEVKTVLIQPDTVIKIEKETDVTPEVAVDIRKNERDIQVSNVRTTDSTGVHSREETNISLVEISSAEKEMQVNIVCGKTVDFGDKVAIEEAKETVANAPPSPLIPLVPLPALVAAISISVRKKTDLHIGEEEGEGSGMRGEEDKKKDGEEEEAEEEEEEKEEVEEKEKVQDKDATCADESSRELKERENKIKNYNDHDNDKNNNNYNNNSNNVRNDICNDDDDDDDDEGRVRDVIEDRNEVPLKREGVVFSSIISVNPSHVIGNGNGDEDELLEGDDIDKGEVEVEVGGYDERKKIKNQNFTIQSVVKDGLEVDVDIEDEDEDELALLQSEINDKTALTSTFSSLADFMIIGTKINLESKLSILSDLSWASAAPPTAIDSSSSLFCSANFTTSDTTSFPLPRLYSLDPVDNLFSMSSDSYIENDNFMINDNYNQDDYNNDDNNNINDISNRKNNNNNNNNNLMNNLREDDEISNWRKSNGYNNITKVKNMIDDNQEKELSLNNLDNNKKVRNNVLPKNKSNSDDTISEKNNFYVDREHYLESDSSWFNNRNVTQPPPGFAPNYRGSYQNDSMNPSSADNNVRRIKNNNDGNILHSNNNNNNYHISANNCNSTYYSKNSSSNNNGNNDLYDGSNSQVDRKRLNKDDDDDVLNEWLRAFIDNNTDSDIDNNNSNKSNKNIINHSNSNNSNSNANDKCIYYNDNNKMNNDYNNNNNNNTKSLLGEVRGGVGVGAGGYCIDTFRDRMSNNSNNYNNNNKNNNKNSNKNNSIKSINNNSLPSNLSPHKRNFNLPPDTKNPGPGSGISLERGGEYVMRNYGSNQMNNNNNNDSSIMNNGNIDLYDIRNNDNDININDINNINNRKLVGLLEQQKQQQNEQRKLQLLILEQQEQIEQQQFNQRLHQNALNKYPTPLPGRLHLAQQQHQQHQLQQQQLQLQQQQHQQLQLQLQQQHLTQQQQQQLQQQQQQLSGRLNSKQQNLTQTSPSPSLAAPPGFTPH